MQLCEQDITLIDRRVDKAAAIALVAQQLQQAGCITAEYLPGMLARESQLSTFLGNGIAIPHGTPETRHAVLHTGVKVMVFPQGVDWGEGHHAIVVVGIASRSDEHLTILRQLTHALIDDAVPAALERASTAADYLAILSGHPGAAAGPTRVSEATDLPQEIARYAVSDPHGLHTRPAALLVKIIKPFSSTVTVKNLTTPSATVDAKKLMSVVSLGAKCGDLLLFTASGPDALQVLAAIRTALTQHRQ